jgi:hypothetical protein
LEQGHTAEKQTTIHGDQDAIEHAQGEILESEFLLTHPSPSLRKKKKEGNKKGNRDPFRQALLELKQSKSPKKQQVVEDFPSGSGSSVDGYNTFVISEETEQSGTMVINDEDKETIRNLVLADEQKSNTEEQISVHVEIEEQEEETKPLLGEKIEAKKSVEPSFCCIII